MPRTRPALALRRLLPLFWIVALATGRAVAQTEKSVPHLETARQLVRDLQNNALTNEYGSRPTFIRWADPTREARTVCATFVTHLFEHTYGWKKDDIHDWLGANGADASEWHDAIVKENGIERIRKINHIHPGDIFAIKYNDDSKDTGHVMVVNRDPERIEATKPLVSGTDQYAVEVIDSSASGHGPDDTRHKPDGGFTGGIGKGEIRLYADTEGRIVGYAWSRTGKSQFYHSPERDFVVGRLTRK